jgi:HPt (histidine-containing phosphotransfer) domain-containing protein
VQSVIDRVHLGRMTLGEHGLEEEVLALFERQAGMLVARMRAAEPTAIAAFAHTLKGSARGVGAWRIAEAAERLEVNAIGFGDRELATAIEQLAAAVIEARVLIADMLRPNASA